MALLHLTLHDGARAWKGHDWDALDRVYRKGMIDNPVSKAKSVVLTDEGLGRASACSESCSRELPDDDLLRWRSACAVPRVAVIPLCRRGVIGAGARRRDP